MKDRLACFITTSCHTLFNVPKYGDSRVIYNLSRSLRMIVFLATHLRIVTDDHIIITG